MYEDYARPRSGRSLLNSPDDFLKKLARKDTMEYASIYNCNKKLKFRWEPRWPGGKISAPGTKPTSNQMFRNIYGPAALNLTLTLRVKHSSAGFMRKFRKGMPLQVSSSSFDHGSK
ncbi:hypothetical protein AVEN_38124-1 [Araneus ventricosus]|uniref:Uncharacterized protein n=1 Tax=Araneus ventricosus TaxID=182803 RepID=A0A4Y2HZQ0_ARAVE|nr:hypothetical protein AVEN_38124-1 [Araneus ventricosus]